MSRWHEAFKNHAVHQHLKNIQSLLKDKAFKKIDAPAEQEISRLKKSIKMIEATLATVDQELVPQPLMDQLTNPLTDVWNRLNSYKSNQNLNEVQAANSALDNANLPAILAALSSASFSKDGIAEVSINAMIERAEDFLETLDKRRKELQKQIAGLKTSVTAAENRLAELQNKIDSKLSELDQILNQWVQKFSDALTSHEERFNALLSYLQNRGNERIDKLISELTESSTRKSKHFEEILEKYLAEAKERHNSIRKIHGLVAEDAITGGFKGSAAKEIGEANFWRWFSVVFLIIAAIWLGFVFWHEKKINWQASIGGFPLTAVLVSVASYAALQSRQHRRQANQQRQFYLEMTAIDPYLENLGEEERKKIKEALAARYFGHVFDDKSAKADKDFTMLPSNLLEKILKLIPKSGG